MKKADIIAGATGSVGKSLSKELDKKGAPYSLFVKEVIIENG